jgi:hypothetical protein
MAPKVSPFGKRGIKGDLWEIETVVTGKISTGPSFPKRGNPDLLFAGEGTLARRIIEGAESLSDRNRR